MVEPVTLPDGRVATIIPLTYGRARIVTINRHCPQTYDDGW